MGKSLIDLAYDVVKESNGPISFKELFEKVIALSGLSLDENTTKREMSKLYTNLSLDGRLACFAGNTWDLRSRHLYKETYVNISEYDNDDSTDDEEEKKLLKEELGEEDDDFEDKDDSGEEGEEETKSPEEEDF